MLSRKVGERMGKARKRLTGSAAGGALCMLHVSRPGLGLVTACVCRSHTWTDL
jgi:hypothetical protein